LKNNIYISCQRARNGLFSIEMPVTFRQLDRQFKAAEKIKAKFGVGINTKF